MLTLAKQPQWTAAAAERVAADLFGIPGRATPLPSERDQNFRLAAADGRVFVVKIANGGEAEAMLAAENAAMRHLSSTGLCPVPISPLSPAREIARVDGHLVRVVTWLSGRALGEAAHRPHALLVDLGRRLGEIDRALTAFDHPAVHRDFYWDLAAAPTLIRDRLPLVTEPGLRQAIERSLDVYADTVAPRLAALRHSVIHGDVNDYNVLVDTRTRRVTGIVDFGDMVHSQTVNDLAIAMAYASLGGADPVGAGAAVVSGYHASHPLNEDEVAVLYGLMCLRLSLSASVAVTQRAERADDEYLGISQAAIQDTLPRLTAVHPRLAHYRFRHACGLPPVPHAARVVDWLRANAGRCAPLTGHDLRTAPVAGVDLSAGSPLVASHPAENAPEPLGRRIFAAMADAGAAVGVGGYNEARLVYGPEAFAIPGSDERRTIHIGVDLTMAPGSLLYAPLDGVVHGFEDGGRGDYGPVMVLRHEIPDDPPLPFYTLYGHLDRESIHGLVHGRPIRAGEPFARIGAPPDNGDWWPHVHVQIITDMLDVPCNVNGVAAASQRDTWLSLCPDPNLILGVPAASLPHRPSAPALVATRRRHMGANVRLAYGDRPLQVVRGWMQYLFDDAGRRYLDAYNNVPHVGHAHPRVTSAVAAQLGTLNTNTRYLNDVVVQYAAALAGTFPAPLEVCYFTASGSEANELALRLARAYTGARDLVVMAGAYHGHTTTLIDISPYKHSGPGGAGAPDWVHTSPVPDVYRGAYRASDPDAGLAYARDVAVVIDAVAERGRRLCGYIAETCPSVGGQILLPRGFLAEVYRHVRAADGVCIADEVQTGFGRLGTHFWAFEAHDVVPDIVVLGKPIANGYPMGAVVTTRAIAERFDNGMEFFSTFGGSTAACAAALATLQVTVDEQLQAHALEVGAHLLTGLRRLQARHDLIGDVRGSGLFIGVELVRDRTTLAPAAAEAADVVERMRELGVLTGTDGPHHNVIKLRGPMPLTAADADRIVAALDVALSEIAG